MPSPSTHPTQEAREANPALDAFVTWIAPERVWAEVLIQSAAGTFALRHAADRALSAADLRPVSTSDLRNFAMFTGSGRFRPLRSAPDLRRGWLLTCTDPQELWRAVQELYPGSIPDWFAARSAKPPATSYREFTNRQSGMYRITQLLSDAQAASVTRAACHPRFCLKQRLWTAPGLPPESSESKSSIPCLEPCAMLLELARKTARVEQEDKLDVRLCKSELQSFLAAVQTALESAAFADRTGNIAAPSNPRRLQLLIEKFKDYSTETPDEKDES